MWFREKNITYSIKLGNTIEGMGDGMKRRTVKKRNMVVVASIARGGAGAGLHRDKRRNRHPKHKRDWRKDENQ